MPKSVNRVRANLGSCCVALALTLAAPTASAHQELFQPRVVTGERALPLLGSGVLRFGRLIDVYAAALYAPPAADARAVLAAGTPKRLELYYYRRIAREQIIDAAETMLRKQLGESGFGALRPTLDAWHSGLRGVEQGDRYALEYDGLQLRLLHNDRLVARSEDARLAAAYFGIWLDEPAISPRLRAELLRTDRPTSSTDSG